ncbi:hypothetical protein ABMA09_26230 (plasmid) [Erwinia rhapontici]|uniref:DUF411 domain-containing protein n=1 Tax=Erwinia rhapontici TaxID=55212 RepID=UPI003D35AF0A
MKKTLLMASMLLVSGISSAATQTIQLYKTPQCGCCTAWASKMEQAGFKVQTHVMTEKESDALKAQWHVPAGLHSCHTALMNGMVLEGHVPAEDIRAAQAVESDVYGLATPGMPVGSPGMEQDGKHEAYSVMRFDESGQTGVFSRHE